MDPRKDKRSRELEYARMLSEHVPDLAGARLSPLHPPEPDVLLERADQRIGIEVTEIHANPRLRMVEGERDKLLLRAQSEWALRKLPPVAVWIHWIPTRLTRRLRRELPQQLVSFLAARLPMRPESLEVDYPEVHAAIGSDCGIEHIFLYTDWEEPTTFEQGMRWEGGEASLQLFQQEIDRKNAKPSSYTGSYTSRWLLLVHHGGKPSSGFDLPSNLGQGVFRSTFDQVWVLSLIGPRVQTLKVAS